MFKKGFFGPNQYRSLFWGSQYLKGTVWWSTNFNFAHNRNGTRTILHENAMLVVVWYSHVPCKLDFWTFSFPIQTLYVKVLKMFFLSKSIPEAFLGSQYLKGTFWWWIDFKITHNTNGARSILHKKCYVSSSAILILPENWTLTVFFSNYKTPCKSLQRMIFWSNQRPEAFFGESIPEMYFLVMNMVKGLHHDRNDVIVMLVLTSSVRLFVFSCQKKWLSFILSSFFGTHSEHH